MSYALFRKDYICQRKFFPYSEANCLGSLGHSPGHCCSLYFMGTGTLFMWFNILLAIDIQGVEY